LNFKALSTPHLAMGLTLLFLLALSSFFPITTGRMDPDTGRIRVLYIGDHGPQSPSPSMDADPLIHLRVAYAFFHVKGDQRKRLNRLYFPRTYRDLTWYDAVIISDTPVDQFEDDHFLWFRNSVVENGSGFVMIGGNAGFGGGPELPWTPTMVQDILPVMCLEGETALGRMEIIRPDHELVQSLPLERRWNWMQEQGVNRVDMRQDAEVLAEVINNAGGQRVPFWATWEVGRGRTFAVTGDWTPMGGLVFMRWAYYGDFAINLMMYLSRNPIPSDLETIHRIRGRYLDYRSTRDYLISVMEFSEKFGANMNPVGEMLVEADETYSSSIGLYIDQNFGESLGILEEAIETLIEASDRAVELKNQALQWIFFAEWTTVTATFAIGTFVVWTLMVRRRLFREVSQTRFVY